MTDSPALEDLPDDAAALRALIVAERAHHAAEIAERDSGLARLNAIIKSMQRRRFGKSSEKLDPDQASLAFDDLETAIAAAEAKEEERDPALKAKRTAQRPKKRGALPAHLPRVETVIDIEDKTCSCCGGVLHVIGEDKSERLDVIPAQFRVLVTRRPKYACRACQDGVHQALAPAHIIEGGLPTEAMIAHLLIGKYADHLPIYRQWKMLERQGIDIDRSCLIEWVGRGIWCLQLVAGRMLEKLKSSKKLFCDETTAPVLDPGRGRTKTGYLWAIARDDRPWRGPDPPGVVYLYAPGRGGEHVLAHLKGFSGVLQVDGYSAYKALTDTARFEGDIELAFCMAHFRRGFYEIAASGAAPIASEALTRIAALYAIEDKIRGQTAEARRAARQAETRPLLDDFKAWIEKKLNVVSKKSEIAEAIRYGLKRWEGLTRFVDDGRIEIDNNTVERSIRPLALNRKNSLFAGSDEGGSLWGVAASLIETCKLNGVEPQAYLTDVLTKIAQGWPKSRLDELLPWAYVKPPADNT